MTDRTAAELEVDAEAARAQITSTAETIRSKMSPGQLIDEFTGILGGGDGAATLANLRGQIRDNPLPLTLIGAGVAWLMLGSGTSSGGSSGSDRSSGNGLRDYAGSSFSSGRRTGASTGAGAGWDEDYSNGRGETAAPDQPGMLESALESATALVSDAADASRSAIDTAKGAVAGAGERIAGASERIAGATSGAGSMANDLGRRARQSAQEVFQREPLVLAALGLAVGTAIGAMLPGTSFEDEQLGGYRDKLRDAAGNLIDKGVEGAKEVAAEAYETIKDEADQHGLGGSGDVSVVEQVGKIVRSAAEKTEDSVRERIGPA
jgi:hypothetical protein